MTKGKVWLIGAGCGNEDLITVRGLEALRKADAVVYDDLIAPGLLAEASGKEIFYMGKRNGKHSALQEDISGKLAELSLSGKSVARLKGGDPFVFGRGGEEAERLIKEGIPFEVIPGISSSIAIPGMAGIPVTQRKISRGFMVVTGHTAKGGPEIPEDIDSMASFSGTLVILMGLTRLRKIADALMGRGKDPSTPSAVISGGNSPNPGAVRGKLSEIADLAEAEGVSSPAVIVIGETAALDFRTGRENAPLRGVRIGITGTPEYSRKLSDALREKGASVVDVLPVKVTSLPFDTESLLDGKKKWVVFTSSNGVRTFFRKLSEDGTDLRRLAALSFAVIGRPTGNTLRSYGVIADLCPETYTSRDLAERIAEGVPASEEMILLRAENATDTLPSILKEKGYGVREVAVYRTEADGERGNEDLPPLDFLAFSSAGGVKLFKERFGKIPEGVRTVAIGKITKAALEEEFGKCDVTAETAEVESIAKAVETAE